MTPPASPTEIQPLLGEGKPLPMLYADFGLLSFYRLGPRFDIDLQFSCQHHVQICTFSYTKYPKRKYCNRQKIPTPDFDESPRFRPP
ncbi:hypothetical protein AVEN_139192-1 [Araneus ventricosus]|uniref:Uncharacterized protein n=1 Tax=Araneus ventricosus TaxID=182803 RepID=A0A4Y2N6R3_ARAVE|nr:hypothetical protein AVEN_139192-1 [Araneus ventricosus]